MIKCIIDNHSTFEYVGFGNVLIDNIDYLCDIKSQVNDRDIIVLGDDDHYISSKSPKFLSRFKNLTVYNSIEGMLLLLDHVTFEEIVFKLNNETDPAVYEDVYRAISEIGKYNIDLLTVNQKRSYRRYKKKECECE